MSDVQVLVDGKAYSGWKAVSIERSIEQLSGLFELSVSEVAPNGDAAKDLHDGQKVSVTVEGETVITGFIDDIEINHSATEHGITISGRDIAADLVDCSAFGPPDEWNDQGMLAIVKDLLKPFNIPIKVDTNLGNTFAKWTVELGESVFENLDKLARHRGVLIISDGIGGIVITQPGTEVIGTALVLGENILRGQLTRSCKQRFSEYRILGEGKRDDHNEPASLYPRGTHKDSYITRYRPFVGHYEDSNASIKTLTDRAKWQACVNAAKAQRAIITVQGWKHADGIWSPNKQVVVTDERLRLDKVTLLIAGVRYQLSDQGTTTELTLTPRDSFLVDKMPEEIALWQ